MSRNLSSVARLNRSTRSWSKFVTTDNILAWFCYKQKTKQMLDRSAKSDLAFIQTHVLFLRRRRDICQIQILEHMGGIAHANQRHRDSGCGPRELNGALGVGTRSG